MDAMQETPVPCVQCDMRHGLEGILYLFSKTSMDLTCVDRSPFLYGIHAKAASGEPLPQRFAPALVAERQFKTEYAEDDLLTRADLTKFMRASLEEQLDVDNPYVRRWILACRMLNG